METLHVSEYADIVEVVRRCNVLFVKQVPRVLYIGDIFNVILYLFTYFAVIFQKKKQHSLILDILLGIKFLLYILNWKEEVRRWFVFTDVR